MACPPVYLDHIATTPCDPEVVEGMTPYLRESFHNPQSIYPPAEEVAEAIEAARVSVGTLIGAAPDEISFTSGATESNNWAIKALLQPWNLPKTLPYLVTSAVEHVSVLAPCRTLERSGFELNVVGVDAEGTFDLDQVRTAVLEGTALVTMTLASNEIGTIEPIAEVSAICRERGVLLHVDASNVAGIIPVDVAELGASLMTISGHMFGAPKGVGALYLKRGLRWPSMLEGGAQESGRRAGTENVASIVGLGIAAELAGSRMSERLAKVMPLRDRIMTGVEGISGVRSTGHPTKRLPHHASCVVNHVEAESLLLELVMDAGIYAASGTACSGRQQAESYVLEAIGLGNDMRSGSLVMSVGEATSDPEIDYLLAKLPVAIERLRSLSPLT